VIAVNLSQPGQHSRDQQDSGGDAVQLEVDSGLLKIWQSQEQQQSDDTRQRDAATATATADNYADFFVAYSTVPGCCFHLRYDTIDDLQWKTDRQAARLI